MVFAPAALQPRVRMCSAGFGQVYPVRNEDFRPVIRETVYKYLGCGDLKQGFARVRCRDCGGTMRIVAFVEEPRVVRAIPEHLPLWDEPLD